MTPKDVIALLNEQAGVAPNKELKQMWLNAAETVSRLKDGYANVEHLYADTLASREAENLANEQERGKTRGNFW